MIHGYARTSTADQNAALQHDALAIAGCERIVTEQGSGAAARPLLDALLGKLTPGDVLTVWKLDRLGRSLPDLLRIVAAVEAAGAQLRSLTDGIDTTTPGGRLTFHIMGALAEFERSLIVERTQAGLQAAKKRGQRLGRRPALTPAQADHACQLVAQGERVKDIAKLLKVSPDTVYRALRAR